MKYIYQGKGYIEGLPAQDLEDTELTEEQKVLLERGVKAGLYKPAK